MSNYNGSMTTYLHQLQYLEHLQTMHTNGFIGEKSPRALSSRGSTDRMRALTFVLKGSGWLCRERLAVMKTHETCRINCGIHQNDAGNAWNEEWASTHLQGDIVTQTSQDAKRTWEGVTVCR